MTEDEPKEKPDFPKKPILVRIPVDNLQDNTRVIHTYNLEDGTVTDD